MSDAERKRRARTPDHIAANMEDLLAIMLDELQPLTREMIARVERERRIAADNFDQRRAVALGDIALLLARYLEAQNRAERKVRDARNGEYREYVEDEK